MEVFARVSVITTDEGLDIKLELIGYSVGST